MSRLSFVAPVPPGAADALAATARSLSAQTCPHWDLVRADLADDDGVCRDPIAVVNAAVARAPGEYVALVDPGDALAPVAVERVLERARDGVDLVYSDEDEIDVVGAHTNPFLKPGWSPDRLRCQPYTGRLAAFRNGLVAAVGGLRAGFAGAEEHDLALRASERADRVEHVAEVLYHRRVGTGTPDPVPHTEASRRVVAEHLERTAFPATVDADGERPGLLRLRPKLREQPLVSIVIPTAGRARMVYGGPMTLVVNCVEHLVARSTYANYEIVCVIGDETGAAALAWLAELAGDRLRLVPNPGPFNFAAAVNRGVSRSRGHYLLVLNDDTQVITPEWIEAMLIYAQDPDVGAVGAKLHFADGRIQHAGIIAPGRGGPGHPYYGFPREHDGYTYNLRVPSNYLAVTAACLMTRRDCFDAVGGFATLFPLNYNDVDYCLKLRHRGYRIVFTPEAGLYHFELSSRGTGEVASEELAALDSRWGSLLEHDPYYNRAFLPSTDFRPPVRTVAAARRDGAEPSLRAAALPLL